MEIILFLGLFPEIEIITQLLLSSVNINYDLLIWEIVNKIIN